MLSSASAASMNGRGAAQPTSVASERGLRVARVSAPLLDAVLRLLKLLHTPQDAPVLAPLVLREICGGAHRFNGPAAGGEHAGVLQHERVRGGEAIDGFEPRREQPAARKRIQR